MTIQPSIPHISATRIEPIPEWAELERRLISIIDESSLEFADRYTNEDGTLIWRHEWPGMDGSDDPYEGFMNFTMHYIIGGSKELDKVHRKIWDAITWQWTQYGQILNEFDRGYDWMHHGEGLLGFYWFGLANPYVLKDRQRTRNFAALYNGEDKSVDNWDNELKMIRGPISGAAGADHNHTLEGWETHREVLINYLPPFEDLPGVDPYLNQCPWLDDEIYAQIIQKMNERIARGDVPVNLTSTGLMTHAYMYDHDAKHKSWVLDYLKAWEDRTAKNGGIIPDNIGLDGEIGTYNDGKWWGGYYGWRWPHGSMTILEPLLVAGSNAVLLTNGDLSRLNLLRSQLDMLWEMREVINGVIKTPNRHFDTGWRDFRVQNPNNPILLWNISLADEDAQRVERGWVQENEKVSIEGYKQGSARPSHTGAWYQYINGRKPGYPMDILQTNLEAVLFQIERFRKEEWNPYTMDHDRQLNAFANSIHDWQILQPAILEALTQLTLGGPMVSYHGGHLHVAVRYFDPELRRPGLPEDVAALVTSLTSHFVELTLVNTSKTFSRNVIIQSGAFGEHEFLSAIADGCQEVVVGGKHLEISLPALSSIQLKLRVRRFAYDPTYEQPFMPPRHEQDTPLTIIGRTM